MIPAIPCWRFVVGDFSYFKGILRSYLVDTLERSTAGYGNPNTWPHSLHYQYCPASPNRKGSIAKCEGSSSRGYIWRITASESSEHASGMAFKNFPLALFVLVFYFKAATNTTALSSREYLRQPVPPNCMNRNSLGVGPTICRKVCWDIL